MMMDRVHYVDLRINIILLSKLHADLRGGKEGQSMFNLAHCLPFHPLRSIRALLSTE